MKAVYSENKWHNETALGFKSDIGLKKNWCVVLRNAGLKTIIKRERKQERGPPVIICKAVLCKKQLEGGKNLQISCDAVLDPPLALN